MIILVLNHKLINALLICMTLSFTVTGQYSFTWTQVVPSGHSQNTLELLYHEDDPNAIFMLEHILVFGLENDHVTSIYKNPISQKWSIWNMDNASLNPIHRFNLMKAGVNETAFVHSSSNANSSGYRTTIDHPLLNGNPNAVFIHTHLNLTGPLNNHITGLQYYDGKWTIFNEDLMSPILNGSTYHIVIPESSSLAFTHITNNQSSAVFSLIDHPDLNGNPNAQFFISHNLSQSVNVLDKNIAAYYQPFAQRWGVVTEDLSVMPNGMAFSVVIPDGDLDGYPDYADQCFGYDDAIDRDQDGDPDYCESFGFSDFCDYSKTMVEDHLPGEILRYAAEHSITTDRKINNGAQITFETRNHYLEPGFEVVLGATFDAKHADCLSGS